MFTTIRKTEIITLSSTNALNLVHSNKLSFGKVLRNVSCHFYIISAYGKGGQCTFPFFLSHLSATCSRRTFRVVQCPPWVFKNFLNIFSSQTAGPIQTKLGRNFAWEVLFKKCSQNFIPSNTLIAMATKWIFLTNSLKMFSSGTTGHILQECSFGDPFQKRVGDILIHP